MTSDVGHIDEVQAIQFYTRPGCGISASLGRRLRRLGFAVEYHDIWRDASAAAFVRSVARGNETVPTLVVGDAVLIAPSVRKVMAAAAEHAPHLLPEPVTPSPRRGWTARLRRHSGPTTPGA